MVWQKEVGYLRLGGPCESRVSGLLREGVKLVQEAQDSRSGAKIFFSPITSLGKLLAPFRRYIDLDRDKVSCSGSV